jgi:hypothetical protein
VSQPNETQHLVTEFVRLNAKLKKAPLTGAELARWQFLKKALVQAQQTSA